MFDFLQQSYALFLAQRMYARRFSRYGMHPKGVLWKSGETQRLRYRLLTEAVGDKSINDFGCGYGGLLEYLMREGYQGRYIGYDMNAQMIAAAKDRFRAASFFRAKHVFIPADITIISGTLNLKMSASNDAWWRWIEHTLVNCWRFSRDSLRFNLLREADAQKRSPDLFYCDEELVLRFCRSRLSKRVIVQRSTELTDLSVYVMRSGLSEV